MVPVRPNCTTQGRTSTAYHRVKIYILVIWIILNSGAWVVRTNTFVVAFNFFCIVAAAIKVYVLDHRQSKRPGSTIILIGVAGSLVMSFLANGDFRAAFTYVVLESTLLLGYLVSITLSFEDFKRTYVNIVLAIAAISLLFAAFNTEIANIAYRFPLVEGMTASYHNLYVYLYPLYSPYRNPGVFWEPGAFAVFLSIALMFVVFSSEGNRRTIAKSAILVAAIMTTRSTAGYLSLLITSFAYMFARRTSRKTVLPNILPLIVVVLMLTNASVTGNLRNKLSFMSTGNTSSLTRWYSTLGGLEIVRKNPLFGVGFNGYPDAASLYSQRVGYFYNIDANTITYAGALFGIGFMAFLITALWSIRNNFELSALSRALVGILFVLLFLPENFIQYPILYVLAFYGLNSSGTLTRKWIRH